MPEPIDVSKLVDRPESTSSLVRFEDDTDKNAPRLNYAIPLPGSYEGRFYLEVESADELPWSNEALGGESKTKEIRDTISSGKSLADSLRAREIVVIPDRIFDPTKPRINPPVTIQSELELPSDTPSIYATSTSLPDIVKRGNENYLQIEDDLIPIAEIEANAKLDRALVVYQTFGGTVQHTYIPEAQDEESANPRFVIVEHYRLSSHFGNYGAGRTIQTFTLWPGEETKLYVRSWRRTERRLKEASTIFDSYTQEAADDFERSLESENTYKSSLEKSKSWKAEGGFGINLGIVKIGGGGGGGGSSKSARESTAKTVSKVSSHHASKASAKRETTVSTDLETSEASEFETITERLVKNVNLSRVLNLVCRELNQEFTTYLSLIDVSVAFVNDRHIYEEVPIYDIDRLLNKYLNNAWNGEPPQGADADPRKYMKEYLLNQMSTVFDYNGTQHALLEEAPDLSGGKYWRVKRSKNPAYPNPFYEDGYVPVEGIVLEETRHTVRTDGIIIDALLGHGVALDNYALGTQQEVLLEKQLNNKKLELALKLIEGGEKDKADLFKLLFIDAPEEVVRTLASLSNLLESKKENEAE